MITQKRKQMIISSDYYDKSIIISPILFYVGIVSFSFSQNSLNLLFIFLIPLSFIYGLIGSLYLFLKKESVKNILPKTIILLSPLLLFPIIKIVDLFEDEIALEAESDVHQKLYLYSNNRFKETEVNLLGTEIEKGKYQILGDEVVLTYDSVEFYEIPVINLKIKNDSIGSMKIIKYNTIDK